MAGPIWNQKIHDVEFVKRLLDVVRTSSVSNLSKDVDREVNLGTSRRIIAVLTSIIDEDIIATEPLSYDLAHVASTLRCENPSKPKIIAAFRSLNYMIA